MSLGPALVVIHDGLHYHSRSQAFVVFRPGPGPGFPPPGGHCSSAVLPLRLSIPHPPLLTFPARVQVR